MLDELFEMFERDNDRGGRRADGAQKRGIRGFFSRRFGGGGSRPIDDAGAAPVARQYRDDDHDDDDDTYGRDRRRGRRRDRDQDDGFDFD